MPSLVIATGKQINKTPQYIFNAYFYVLENIDIET